MTTLWDSTCVLDLWSPEKGLSPHRPLFDQRNSRRTHWVMNAESVLGHTRSPWKSAWCLDKDLLRHVRFLETTAGPTRGNRSRPPRTLSHRSRDVNPVSLRGRQGVWSRARPPGCADRHYHYLRLGDAPGGVPERRNPPSRRSPGASRLPRP